MRESAARVMSESFRAFKRLGRGEPNAASLVALSEGELDSFLRFESLVTLWREDATAASLAVFPVDGTRVIEPQARPAA